MKTSVLIVEDEPLIAEDISQTLSQLGYNIVGCCDSGEEAISLLHNVVPALALLDIKIKGSIDGISLAHEINKKFFFPFIFLTSYYDQKTLDRAKVTSPSGYIVKPFDENDLKISIEIALNKNKPHWKNDKIDKFFVKKNSDLIAINATDILFVEAFDNYCKVNTQHEQYIVSHTLKSVAEKLLQHGFVRVHRSFLVNFQRINAISEGYVYLDMHKVPIGSFYKEELQHRLTLL